MLECTSEQKEDGPISIHIIDKCDSFPVHVEKHLSSPCIDRRTTLVSPILVGICDGGENLPRCHSVAGLSPVDCRSDIYWSKEMKHIQSTHVL